MKTQGNVLKESEYVKIDIFQVVETTSPGLNEVEQCYEDEEECKCACSEYSGSLEHAKVSVLLIENKPPVF